MILSKRPYKGTRDFFPAKKRVQDYIFSKMRMVAELFGYEQYDGPLIEDVDLYKAKSGEELINEQIYSFVDRGKRFVSIRPEMTPTLARMVAQVHREISKPIRWYSIPNLMRYENPQKGRLREHWQFNCDIFGTEGYFGEIEILQLIVKLFMSFGADSSHFEVLINNRIIVDTIFNDLLKVDKDQSYKLYKIIDKSGKVGRKVTDESIKKVGLEEKAHEVLVNYLDIKDFNDLFLFLEKNSLSQQMDEFKKFVGELEGLNLTNYIKFDPSIVRGLDYYTGIVFEVYDKHLDNRRALCGGGAYANLLQIFDESPLSGLGFGLGDVTLENFLEIHDLLPDLSKPQIDLMLTYQIEGGDVEILKMAQSLREEGIKTITHSSLIKINKGLSLASKKGVKFLGFYGEEEEKEEVLSIKNLTTREQESFSKIDAKRIKKFLNQLILIVFFLLSCSLEEVYSQVKAVVKNKEAMIYSDVLRTSIIGKISEGIEVEVGNKAYDQGTILPVVVSGKVAWIEVKDLSFPYNEPLDYPFIIPDRKEIDTKEISLKAISRKKRESRLLVSAGYETFYLGGGWQQSSALINGAAQEEYGKNISIRFGHHYPGGFITPEKEIIDHKITYGINIMTIEDKDLSYNGIFLAADLLYNFFKAEKFTAGVLTSLFYAPSYTSYIECQGIKQRGSNLGGSLSLEASYNLLLGMNLEIDAGFLYQQFFSYETSIVFDPNYMRVYGAQIGGGVSYTF